VRQLLLQAYAYVSSPTRLVGGVQLLASLPDGVARGVFTLTRLLYTCRIISVGNKRRRALYLLRPGQGCEGL